MSGSFPDQRGIMPAREDEGKLKEGGLTKLLADYDLGGGDSSSAWSNEAAARRFPQRSLTRITH